MIKETYDISLINSFLNNFNTSIKSISIYSKYYIYYLNQEPIGFLNFDLIYDRIEIIYIFVEKNYRNRKIGTELLNNMMQISKKENCKNITLEVRKSNDIAINFYKKFGFSCAAIREKYYNSEDGILMIKEMF